ncbi:MAG TPA: 50S ribosomal protein L18 [Treponemataceae bacterium]|jgi:large subunit ribosomal protein L18|nr:MAG: 50S ribosomal protein L18 [Spirochaetes bacterium ADurb.Bin269]TAH55913.1 MAG: 50S ribosomal protein L18 [Treponema sp.]HOC29468.1 50S ribosomal protein L18 [Treponemataceae bacterium]HPX47955.1 50S ribosomal protein L18 [Treponemataceae bacterium]HQL33021.1 50S ribosomal protein L18 [Treponemataceae bacterium]
MFKKLNDKDRKRLKRKIHIRKRVAGTAERPRMTVTRSNKNLTVQVIDDVTGSTLAAVSTLEKELSELKSNLASGTKVGEEIGRRLKEKNITSVVFDRNGYLYHGVVKAVADGARSAGINF